MRLQAGTVCLGVCILCLAPFAADAQSSTLSAVTPAGVAIAPVSSAGFEQYNSFNGSLGLSIPLHHIGGRGEGGFGLVWNLQPNWVAAYNSPNPGALVVAAQYPTGKVPNGVGNNHNSSGLLGPGAVYIRTGYTWQYCSSGYGYQPVTSATTITFVMPNGGQLSLLDTSPTTATSGPGRPLPRNSCQVAPSPEWDDDRGTSFRSTDGSQIQFNASADVQEQGPNWNGYGVAEVSGTLVFPTGVVYTVVNSQITAIQDRNGNKITLTYGGPSTPIDWYLAVSSLTQVTDSLGNVTNVNYAYSDQSGNCSSCIGITYPGYNGTRVVKVLSGTLGPNTLRSDFSSGGAKTVGSLFLGGIYGIYQADTTTYAPPVTTAIVMPDGNQYSFLYNPYGEVAQMTLPTQGYIQYDYGEGAQYDYGGTPENYGGFLQTTNGVMIYRRLLTRREYGSYNTSGQIIQSSTTTHSAAYPTGQTTDTIQIQDPTNSNAVVAQTINTFDGSPTDALTMTGTSCTSVNEGLETTTSSGYPGTLRTVTYTYSNGNSGSCQTNPQLMSVTTTNDANQQSKLSYIWDSYNNVTDEKDYDWGSGSPGGLLREIQTIYLYQNNANYAPAASNSYQMNLIHLPYSKSIVSGSTTAATTTWYYDETGQLDSAPTMINNCTNSSSNCTNNYGAANNLRGNMTHSTQSYNGGSLQTSFSHYDVGGNLTYRSNQDGVNTTLFYNDAGNNYAFPITITNGLGQSSTLTYNYAIGKPLTAKDALGNTTSYQYADSYDRLTQIQEPVAGATETIGYASPTWTITAHTQASGTQTQSQVVSDPMGRDIEDRTFTDQTAHLIAVDHSYNALGLVAGSTNPSLIAISGWTSDGLGYQTVYSYDSLGRVSQVALPDGTGTTTSYSGNSTTVTDAASRATKTVTNALGEVTSVYEDPNNSNLQTNYTYDLLGNLNTVLKCSASGCSTGQTRTFNHDSLSRLTSAVNPESGTYTYSYSNSSGNRLALQSRTDPRGFTTTYGYDAMDKLTSVTYNDGTPNSSYTYNAKGQITQSSNSNVTNNYLTFDSDGRVLTSNVVMGGVTYPFTYVYDLAGDLTQEIYPSGRTVNYTYDAARRPATVNGVSAGVTTNYVQASSYWPHGAPESWQYGNGLWCWQNVNKVLTSWETWATQNNNGNNWMFVAYNGFDNSDNVIAQTEGFGPGVPWNSMTFLNGQFQYDNLSRLTSVTDTNYTRAYHFDEFGNQSIQSYSGISPVGFAPQNSGGNPFNPATNHLTAVDTAGGYEARGMVTKLGSGTVQMAYDAEGNMKNTSDTGTGQSITWIFDAEGQRAQKLVSGGSWTLYVHDAFGQLAASYNNNGMTPECNGTCYLTYDMLGSVRLVTDTNQIVVARHDFIPFGEEIPNGTAGRNGDFGYTSNVTQGFTGQEADGGTASLDFYNARHFATTLGSFVQPDPMNAGATLLRPQSWNAYAYVLGNPLGAADPTGLQCASRGGLHANMVGCNGGGEYGGTDDPTGGGGGGVSIDGGSPVSIGTFGSGSNPAGGESGTQCPNNACSIVIWSSSPVGTSGLLQQFSGFASGGSGYYSTYGPGSLNYTAQQAGVAAVTYINPTSIAQNVEYSGNVYKDANGIFSFVMPTMGTFNHSPFDPTQVPSGTVYAGAYHTHGGDDPNLPAMDSEVFSPPFNGQLNDIGLYSSPANQGQPAYLGTPAGRVEVYNPQTNKSCVLVGSAVPGISSGVGLVGGVPTCH